MSRARTRERGRGAGGARRPRRARTGVLAAALLLWAAPAAARTAPPLRTEGGEILARRPPGPEWECEANSRAGEGFRLAELRCSRAAAGGTLRLYAKDYDGPAETLAAICGRDWRSYYRGTFREVSRLDARRSRIGGRRVCAVDAEGTSTAGEPLRLREWYAVARRHVLLVTAAGPAEAMRANARAIAAWRDGVRFRAARR
ncbi:MAG TPA: hypothetical protein VFL83_23285 [Anaeromyxobacter sp.]|nr:hypothetical protein [Anaeromyxobacter sp.]